jgi:lysozyme
MMDQAYPEIELVKGSEGFHRVVKGAVPVMAGPYLCPAGFWTIGWGSLCRPGQLPITMAEGELRLIAGLDTADRAISRFITWPLSPWQRAALRSWVYNLGAGRLQASTLRAKINRGELDDVPDEIRKWKWGGGRVLPGLVIRREGEVGLWNRG